MTYPDIEKIQQRFADLLSRPIDPYFDTDELLEIAKEQSRLVALLTADHARLQTNIDGMLHATSVGFTNAQFATRLMKLCGIDEQWTDRGHGNWESSHAELRKAIELDIQVTKNRVGNNVHDYYRSVRATETVKRFLAEAEGGGK